MLSELPLFERGLPSLEPGGRITCYWDDLGDLLPNLRENERTADHVSYTDLTGNRYDHDWDVEPAAFEDIRDPGHKGMDDLVEAVEGLPGDWDEAGNGRRSPARPSARDRDGAKADG